MSLSFLTCKMGHQHHHSLWQGADEITGHGADADPLAPGLCSVSTSYGSGLSHCQYFPETMLGVALYCDVKVPRLSYYCKGQKSLIQVFVHSLLHVQGQLTNISCLSSALARAGCLWLEVQGAS
jgi:hypothetical protein